MDCWPSANAEERVAEYWMAIPRMGLAVSGILMKGYRSDIEAHSRQSLHSNGYAGSRIELAMKRSGTFERIVRVNSVAKWIHNFTDNDHYGKTPSRGIVHQIAWLCLNSSGLYGANTADRAVASPDTREGSRSSVRGSHCRRGDCSGKEASVRETACVVVGGHAHHQDRETLIGMAFWISDRRCDRRRHLPCTAKTKTVAVGTSTVRHDDRPLSAARRSRRA